MDDDSTGSRIPRHCLRRDRGFVLVSVLWISGVVAVFAISVSLSVRSHALYTRNSMSLLLAQGIADGLVRLTALEAATAPSGGRARKSDSTWTSCRWNNGAEAWVSVQDQSGLVDLNTASEQLMIALLSGLGLPAVQAADMATDIRDYRDSDSDSGLQGVEPVTYPGRQFGPKNAPFEAVEELDQIPGMTPALLLRLVRLTTVATEQTGFDFGTAPAELLQTLQLTRTSVAGLSFSSPRTSRAREITAAVQLPDGTRFVRRAMIDIAQQPLLPFEVKAWDTGGWPMTLEGQTGTAGPCLAT